jgi:hypothetical protein
VGKLSGGTKIATAAAGHPKIPTAIAPSSGIGSRDLLGQQVEAAKAKLAASKITVDTVLPYDKTQVASNVTHYATVPENLKPNTVVTLVADEQGVVQYYTLSSPAAAQQQQALNSALTQLAELHKKLDLVQASNAKELATRDLTIQTLQSQVQRISSVVRLPNL